MHSINDYLKVFCYLVISFHICQPSKVFCQIRKPQKTSSSSTSDSTSNNLSQFKLLSKNKQNFLEYDGNTWIKKTGIIDKNSPGYIGIKLPMDSNNYYERLYNSEINVKWFGAIGDGKTNSTAAIQAALDYAKSIRSNNNNTVTLEAGVYIVEGLNIPSKIMLRGTGWNSIIKAKENSNRPIIMLDNSNTQQIIISDLCLDGNKSNQTIANDGISIDNTNGKFDFSDPHIMVQNVLIYNTKGNGLILTSREARLTNVVVRNSDKNGFLIKGTDNFFNDCTAASTGAGYHGYYIEGSNNRFIGCKAFYCGKIGDASDGFYLTRSRNTLSACEAQDNGRNGFTLCESAENTVLSGLMADSNGESGYFLDNSKNKISNMLLNGVLSISRNQGRYKQKNGFNLVNLSNSTIIGMANGNTNNISGLCTNCNLSISSPGDNGTKNDISNVDIKFIELDHQPNVNDIPNGKSMLIKDKKTNSIFQYYNIEGKIYKGMKFSTMN